MRSIGGFFDIEVSGLGPGPHPGAVALSTGRACMALWLMEERPMRCYVPFYCCSALLQPLREAGITYEFYGFDELFYPVGLPERPGSGDWLVWINFFGLISDQVAGLTDAWAGRLLLDNTHAFFEARKDGLWTFTSARKYFGVPDGAYCYRPDGDRTPPNVDRHVPLSVDHLVIRYTQKADQALSLYQAAESNLDCSLKRISLLSERLMAGVDVESLRLKRVRNLAVLVEQLDAYNTFKPAKSNPLVATFSYPFLPAVPIPRQELFRQKIFVPTLWPDLENREEGGFYIERKLAKELLPLPIDQRYEVDDMLRMTNAIKRYLE